MVLFHHVEEAVHFVGDVVVCPCHLVEGGMNRLCSLLPKKPKSSLPPLDEGDSVVF